MLAADDRLAAVELERQVGPEVQPLARHPVAEPPEHARIARPQLRVVVRLGDVVLGDLVEQVGLGVRGVDRRQHDDRQVRPRLDLARERQPVHARHQHVDDQEVRPGLAEAAQRLLAVARRLDLVAVRAQLVREDHEQVRVVVDDQDARRRDAVRAGSTEHGRRIPPRVGPPSAGSRRSTSRHAVRSGAPDPRRPRRLRPGGRRRGELAAVAGRASTRHRPCRQPVVGERPALEPPLDATSPASRSRSAGASRSSAVPPGATRHAMPAAAASSSASAPRSSEPHGRLTVTRVRDAVQGAPAATPRPPRRTARWAGRPSGRARPHDGTPRPAHRATGSMPITSRRPGSPPRVASDEPAVAGAEVRDARRRTGRLER